MQGVKELPSFICSERTYTIEGFRHAAGVNAKRMRDAAAHGVKCKFLVIGKRKFIRGRDGIEYLDQLGELHERLKDHSPEEATSEYQ